MKALIGLFIALLFCSTAQSENYYAASVTKLDVEMIDLTGISGTFGRVFGDNASGELRFGLGVDDDSFYDAYGDYIETEIDHYFGAYLKFSASSEKISPYAIIGLTKVKATVYDSYYDYSESDSEDDFSYGVGVDFANGFFLEYIQYLDKSGLELNGLSLGMKF